MGDGELIDRIYEAAAVPDMWPDVLLDLARSVDGEAAILMTQRSDAWVGWRATPAHQHTVTDYLQSDAAKRSVATARVMALNRAGFVADQEVFSQEEYIRDASMTDYCTPNNLHHAAATVIQAPSHDVALVHVQRRTGRPPFTAEELRRLDAFRPHLARSTVLATRWRLERLRAATEALELIGLPAAVLDASGRVLVANGLIERRTPQVVWLPDNRLAFTDVAATGLLRQAVAALGDAISIVPRSVPIRDLEGDHAAIAHLLPIRGQARDLFGRGLGLLMITSLAPVDRPDPAVIQGLFDLTAAEARIAADLLGGLSVDAIAARRNVTRETVRSQVKAVLAKTGCHRRTEFMVKFQPLLRLG